MWRPALTGWEWDGDRQRYGAARRAAGAPRPAARRDRPPDEASWARSWTPSRRWRSSTSPTCRPPRIPSIWSTSGLTTSPARRSRSARHSQTRRRARATCSACRPPQGPRSRRDRHAPAHGRGGARPDREPRGLDGGAPRGVRGSCGRARRRAARVPPPGRGGRRHRRPDRAQGRDLDEGRRDDRRLQDPRRIRPGLRRHGRGALQGRRNARDREDEHGRVRDGLVDRELGLRAVSQPLGSDARARRFRRRHRGSRLWRSRALGSRLGHGRLDQAAIGLVRQRRAAPDLRHRVTVRDRCLRLEPRPGRARREDRARRGAALLDHRGAGRERFDDGRVAGGGGVAARRDTRRAAHRNPEAGLGPAGHRARCPRIVRGGGRDGA